MARKHFSLIAAVALGAGVAAVAQPGDAAAGATAPVHAYRSPRIGQAVSVDLVSPEGYALSTYWYEGALYVAGSQGQRYNIRLTNSTGERVEAVVSVDGRDVVSGKLGDYRRQRGYILEAYGSVTIDGFRQSLDHVAAFRFSSIGDSYSARRGTPQHTGVIGVAVFREQARRSERRSRPVAPQPYPGSTTRRHYYEPYAREADAWSGASRSSRDDARDKAAPRSTHGRSGGAPDYNAPAAEAKSGELYRSEGQGSYRGDYGGDYDERSAQTYAPAPRPNELGTSFGETQYSSVHEVEFRRHNNRRPDSMVTVHYDSLQGLRARGVRVDPPEYPYYQYEDAPDPWPYAREFAPPPPRRY